MSPNAGKTLLIAATLAAACGHRVPHVAPDESRPHITWEIRTGGDVRDEEFVCGSKQPSRPCVLTASTADNRSLATVRLYLHAAKETTNYLGTMHVPFMEGTGLEEKEVSATVPPGSQPVGRTLNGRVTSNTGNYTFRILLVGTQPGAPTSQRLEEQAAVTVKGAQTAPAMR